MVANFFIYNFILQVTFLNAFRSPCPSNHCYIVSLDLKEIVQLKMKILTCFCRMQKKILCRMFQLFVYVFLVQKYIEPLQLSLYGQGHIYFEFPRIKKVIMNFSVLYGAQSLHIAYHLAVFKIYIYIYKWDNG